MIKITQEEQSSELQFDKNSTTKGIIDGQSFEISNANKLGSIIDFNDSSYNLDIVSIDELTKKVHIKINGVSHELKVEDEMDQLLKKLGMQRGNGIKMNELKAPMPGLVLSILVEEGQEIKKGDALLILEAMKMENSIKAIADAKVKAIKCESGVAVEKNELLIEFE